MFLFCFWLAVLFHRSLFGLLSLCFECYSFIHFDSINPVSNFFVATYVSLRSLINITSILSGAPVPPQSHQSPRSGGSEDPF